MKRILILTASFGEGHNAAARNIREAIEALDPLAEVHSVDLMQAAYGRLNQVARAAYFHLVRHAPSVWRTVYQLLDHSPRLAAGGRWTRLRTVLEGLLAEIRPDCVVSTYPVYGDVIAEIHRDHAERPFRLLTVITDSISINAAWHQSPSDLFCVANEASAQRLLDAGLDRGCIAVTGFPVSPAFQGLERCELPVPGDGQQRRILYILNAGSRKSGRTLEEILELPHTELTVTTGRDAHLKAKLRKRLAPYGERVRLLGWTNLMPQLLSTHHLVVTKAGGATVQEAIAARCPLVINQTIPGQEEGNAQLVVQGGYGCVVDRPSRVASRMEQVFAEGAVEWSLWRENLSRDSRPGAAIRIAQLALQEPESIPSPQREFAPTRGRVNGVSSGRPRRSPARRATGNEPESLLCDFHIHTNYSDGKLTVGEVVDYYGAHGFDCICITDHLADPRRLIGKLARLSRLTLSPAQLPEYFEVIRQEAKRAWRRYGMLVLAGIEFNKDGYTPKTSAHLLGIGLNHEVESDLDLPETIAKIHSQGALAVASHPHLMKSEWGKNTLYLWENQEIFVPLLDAWEIANRDNFFPPVALKRLPFIANSDFHKPRHIYSWKTVLQCEKDPEAIKSCIRDNQRVSITLYRGQEVGLAGGEPGTPSSSHFRPALAPHPLALAIDRIGAADVTAA
ncbi:MAG: UDP-N-acetylglucosamine--LPS N-acetylglucosamine transferase [Verrucomicrobiales bacterium]|nr:UDP-N-acetylglucosamine--LPS N-acetylglucosamine transferase [Verrucomicrobiales bacterium]